VPDGEQPLRGAPQELDLALAAAVLHPRVQAVPLDQLQRQDVVRQGDAGERGPPVVSGSVRLRMGKGLTPARGRKRITWCVGFRRGGWVCWSM
jgi:hypothetical protein